MAITEILTGDAQAVKRWSTRMMVEAIGQTYIKRFMGSSKSAILQVHNDLSKGAGDDIKYDLLPLISGFGVFGDTRLKGQEKALTYFQDSLKIEQQREGITWGRMTQQRTLHDIMEDSVVALSKFWGRVMDQFTLAQLCGTAGTAGEGPAVAAAITAHGVNALVAPDAGHTIATGAIFTVDNFRKLREKAALAAPIVQPTMVEGSPKYVVMLRPEAVTSMKNEVTANKWREITAQAESRGASNPIYTGALGEFDGCVIHESIYLPKDTGGTQLNYGVLLGAQAGSIAFGRSYQDLGSSPSKSGGENFSFFDDVDDYGNEIGISAATIWGVKKNRFNSLDYGTVRITSTENPQ